MVASLVVVDVVVFTTVAACIDMNGTTGA